jgi:Uma2 family endonuclease
MSQAALQCDFVSEEDYLAGEPLSDVRHEYLGGYVYALAGETRAHNTFCLNLALLIRDHLRGGPCQAYVHDIRVNFRLNEDRYYYYPDLVVPCDPRDTHPRFVQHPKLLIEVLSESTQRVDQRENFFAYTTLPSLEEYVLVAQGAAEFTVFRRGTGWKAEAVSGRGASVRLDSIGLTLPLDAAYEGL